MSTIAPNSVDAWKTRIDACKKVRRQLVRDWGVNVDYRRGKPFTVQSDENRVNVNTDWSMTRAKHAALWSVTPSVVLTSAQVPPPVLQAFGKALNDTLTRANVGAAVDESVIDTINAAGIGAVLVAYEARLEEVEVPAVDPAAAAVLQQAGQEVPTVKGQRPTSTRFVTQRLSPSDLLWPVEFINSDFDQAPWIGRSGRMTWSEAKHAFGLTEAQRDDVNSSTDPSRLNLRNDRGDVHADLIADVEFDEIFYRLTAFDEDAKYFDQIQRVVFVTGLDRPVIDEPWKGQQFDPSGTYLGSCKFPIRILTLTYISDDPIPPSDTAIGRPQVNELIQSRTQMLMQRDRSIPLRWHDVNRLDPLVASNLMLGTWQGSIPVQGSGDAVIGEVKRAQYPADDYTFDRIAKSDLAEQWSLGANQVGQFASGERSATEAQAIQQSNAARIGYERARVAAFYTGIAEVMAGLVALYQTSLQLPNQTQLAGQVVYTVRPDSTIRLDSDARLKQLAQFLNLTANSGYINPKPILEEMAALANVDVSQVVHDPQPKPPEGPNIGYSFKGEDLLNPLALAIMMKDPAHAPGPQEVEAAKRAILSAQMPPQPMASQPQMPMAPPRIGPGIDAIVKRSEEVQ